MVFTQVASGHWEVTRGFCVASWEFCGLPAFGYIHFAVGFAYFTVVVVAKVFPMSGLARTLVSINPFTEEVLERFPVDTEEQVAAKLRRAVEAFREWREATVHVRCEALLQVAERLKARKEELAVWITKEMGKPIRQSRAEIEKCAWLCEYFAEVGREWLEPEAVATEADWSGVRYDPLGVILGIMPWNFPFWQVMRFAVPALLAGNAVVVKHASNVPICARLVEEVFQSALPVRYAFQMVWLTADQVSRVLDAPEIAGVSVTGSTEAGRSVAMRAGARLLPSVMELGGSDAFIVFPDANLARAVEVAVAARLQNNGQSCIAGKRFLIADVVAPRFLELLTERLEQIRVGDPMEEQTDVGPLARKDLCEELGRQVEASLERGGRLRWKSPALPDRGFFYPVTVVENVRSGMPLFDEEVFGPVFAVTVAPTEQLLELANASGYGLGASVWTNSRSVAEEAIRRLETGMVFVNALVKSDPRLPFGGVKASGYGRELGRWGLYAFTNVKTVWMEV